MPVMVNGEELADAAGITVSELIARLEMEPRVTVVIRGGRVIRREEYDRVRLEEGDDLAVMPLVGGG